MILLQTRIAMVIMITQYMNRTSIILPQPPSSVLHVILCLYYQLSLHCKMDTSPCSQTELRSASILHKCSFRNMDNMFPYSKMFRVHMCNSEIINRYGRYSRGMEGRCATQQFVWASEWDSLPWTVGP